MLPAHMGKHMLEPDAVALTPRERQVLELLAHGQANKEIAEALSCTVRTVEFHISNLLRKVGASSRLELVTQPRYGVPSGALSTSDAPFIEVRLFAGTAAVVLGDTVLMLWTAPATLERWSWNAALIDEVGRSHAEGAQCLSMVLTGSDPPDRLVCRRIRADLSCLGQRLRRFVGVALGDSFRSGAVHAIMRGVFFLSGQSDRLAVAANLQQGFRYILESAGPSTPALSQLELAVSELSRLRAAFGNPVQPSTRDLHSMT